MTIGVPCPNCGSATVDRFCAGCGQKRVKGRLDLAELLGDFFRAVVDVDHGVLRLLRDLALRPGTTYQDYLDGRRKRYVNAVFFLLLAEGAFVLLDAWLLRHRIALRTAELRALIPAPDLAADRFLNRLRAESVILQVDKYKYLLGIPLLTATTWPWYRAKYTLAEVAAFWILCLGFLTFVDLLGFPFRWLLPEHHDRVRWLFGWIAGLVALWHIMAFFGARSVGAVLKCVLIAAWLQLSMNLCFRAIWVLQGYDVSYDWMQVLRDSFGV